MAESIEGQIITKNLESFNDEIKDDIIRKGIKNTGGAASSLKVVNKGNSYVSVGNDYIEVLDTGRSPGKYAPVKNIQEWVRTKLGITDDKKMKQVAFLVNRKIKNEGTAIYKNKAKGLEIDKKINKLSDNLRKDLMVFAIADVKKQLNKFQKQRQVI